jgi:hypothetical protein
MERACGTRSRVGLDNVEGRKLLQLPGLELRPLGRPARSQSLYRLRLPGSPVVWSLTKCRDNLLSCRILGPPTGAYDVFCLLGYNAVQSIEAQPSFGGTCRLYLQGRRKM